MAQITEERYRKLKKDVENTKADADRAQGALDELLKRLKEEFGCDDLKEASALLKEYESKTEKAEKSFEKALQDYERKWKSN